MSCNGCVQEARERNREINNLLTQAKKQAIEEGKAKAICKDEIQGFFISDAQTAIREHFQIIQFVSGLQ